ncbi:hypothetical protein M422DRAFT_24038 [Sphaerobolus stellatus SS14]|nr:hypothetical protein M422DRAFT_24038 [Sphaerobolus stellatus SS14]
MSFCFRRLYSTKIPKPEVNSAFTARIASAPRNVRLRRLRKEERERSPKGIRVPTPSLSPLSLKTAPLSPTEKERYDRMIRIGALISEKRGYLEPTAEEWLEEQNAKRARIRGVVKREIEDPETGEMKAVDDVVGVRVYLPNVKFYMVRNHTAPGEAYNPWEATFYVPPSFTKMDIRSYLWSVYGVNCTYIRTQILLNTERSNLRVRARRIRAKKRAVVGLVEPFYYPDATEDMPLEDRTTVQEALDVLFQHYAGQMHKRKNLFDAQRYPYKQHMVMGNSRAHILKKIQARRQAREAEIAQAAKAFLPQNKTALSAANAEL